MIKTALRYRRTVGLAALAGITALAAANAQPPRDRGQGGGGVDAAVTRLMTLDANGDGKLSRSEVTDERLHALFQRADANNDGVVTKDELTTQLGKDAAAVQASFGPGGGPGGPGPGGPGPGGMLLAPIMPPFLQEGLNLTNAQRREIDELQKDVETRLSKILTAEQQQQLRQMRGRGPGGSGGPGGTPGGRPPRPQ
jgi:hypothetical protein